MSGCGSTSRDLLRRTTWKVLRGYAWDERQLSNTLNAHSRSSSSWTVLRISPARSTSDRSKAGSVHSTVKPQPTKESRPQKGSEPGKGEKNGPKRAADPTPSPAPATVGRYPANNTR